MIEAIVVIVARLLFGLFLKKCGNYNNSSESLPQSLYFNNNCNNNSGIGY